MDEALKTYLRNLAATYETADFIKNDPSQFMHNYSNPLDQEVAAFISAQVAFGKRELFISKLNEIFDAANPSPYKWIISGSYKNFFLNKEDKFYRFFSYADMLTFCTALEQILKQNESLGNLVRKNYEARCNIKTTRNTCAQKLSQIENVCNLTTAHNTTPDYLSLVCSLIKSFPKCKVVSQNPKGACKKINMFLRWMVRKNSPVDLGLWDWASPKDLLIPLDVHVLQEAKALKLLPQNATANAKTSFMLTTLMKEIWQDDPVRADFALFGLGVNKKQWLCES